MGNLWISAKALLEGLNLEVVVPPPCTKKTLSLGVLHAPEFICLPLKINLGNYIEAAEKGADTIIIAGGKGPCRFGYYCRLEKEIMDDLGYNYEMIVLEPPEKNFFEVIQDIRAIAKCSMLQLMNAVRTAWLKCCAVDEIENKVQVIRARESCSGLADGIYKEVLKDIDRAQTGKEIVSAKRHALEALNEVPVDPEREIVRIALVGEIYTILEPFANQNIEKHLGKLGAEVKRSIYLSSWVNDHLLGSVLPLESTKEACRLAAPYLNYFVGGHGRETVGSAVKYSREGFDGIIQIAPLTCGPEIVAEAILPEVSLCEGIPVMTIYMDEQSGEAGLITRLEAFVDMIRRKKFSQKIVTH